MNGVHDVGGMHGYGPIRPTDGEELFHDEWEARAFGVQAVAIHGAKLFNLDEFRAARERVEPAEYLSSPYYDNWLAAVEKLAVEKGVVSEAELRQKIHRFEDDENLEIPERTDPDLAERTLDRVAEGYSVLEDAEPAFDVGDGVVVRRGHPEGHTRCPWYTRGARATVEESHGGVPLPDAAADGEEVVEPLYTVRFEASELWDGDTDGDVVHIDMWESYLQRPDDG